MWQVLHVHNLFSNLQYSIEVDSVIFILLARKLRFRGMTW